MLDLDGLQQEARPIVRRAAGVYRKHTAPWFIGLVVHGSAVKGGIIPGCSDLDMQLYLAPEALSWHGHLPLELGFAIRRDLEGIELWPFRYLQCYTFPAEMPEGWVGPIPGAYRLVAGRLPVAEATAEDLRRAAVRDLGALAAPTYLVSKLLGPDGEPSRPGGGVRLARSLRLLCTQVWPALYQVLTLQEEDALAVWRLQKGVAVARLPEAGGLRAAGEAFHQAVRAYYPAEDSLEGALALMQAGADCLQAAKAWWEEVSSAHHGAEKTEY